MGENKSIGDKVIEVIENIGNVLVFIFVVINGIFEIIKFLLITGLYLVIGYFSFKILIAIIKSSS